jgi:hypothetical protein
VQKNVKPSEIIRSGANLRIDLLTEYPSSTDPSTWITANWEGYYPQYDIPILSHDDENGIIGKIFGSFNGSLEDFSRVQAIGVQFDGKVIFVAEFEPPQKGGSFMPLEVRFVLQLWQAPP